MARNRFNFSLSLLGSVVLLVACSDYQWTFNDRVIHEPAPLLRGIVVADPALQTCIDQTISDQRVHDIKDLQRLRCSSAGIRSLRGLERLRALRELDLSDNAISDLAPLLEISTLEILVLRNNALTTLGDLACGAMLRQLASRGNDQLACADLDQARLCGISLIDIPEHCQK